MKVGKTLPAWQEGEYDIHFINTGRGECTWQIFPDGTTFLSDASGSLLKYGADSKSDPLTPKPSADITAGQVIVDYINHFSPEVSKGHINYFLLTHFHGDHCGSVTPELPEHESGMFQMSSLAEIGTKLTIDKIMDRDYPDYSYPIPARQNNQTVNNYRGFAEWTVSQNGTEIEKWDVGSCTQVVPVHDPDCGVTVRNYSGSGCFWTGEDEECCMGMPTIEEYEAGAPEAIPDENNMSCSYIATFKDFDFFLGGDMQYNDRENYPYKDSEAQVAQVAHKVEVMKANHHGTFFTHGEEFISTLHPDVWVCSNWRDVQPRPVTVDAVWEANPDCEIFCTNMPERNRNILGEERVSKMSSTYGHVVVRVAPDGKSFMVYTLEDTDENYTVKSVHGPFYCTE
ncbi:MAG: hypothetical protein LUE27_09520 [Clostridia bacterium]|nr:hypothetical protein [Clostridia bacterium]